MEFEVINKKTNRIVRPHNYSFVINQNGELWTINRDGSFTKASDKYSAIRKEQINKRDIQLSQKNVLPLYGVMHFLSKEFPPKNEVVLFGWWNKKSFESSPKTLGYLDDDYTLVLDAIPNGKGKPTFWHFLNKEQ